MTAALQSYADRGVFRGFTAAPAPRGRVQYQFRWLTRRPVHAIYDPRTRTLTFASLFPAVASSTSLSLKDAVADRAGKSVPAHKRIDARRARLTSRMQRGNFSLVAQIRGNNHLYAVRHTLNVINELFVILHEHDPEYLIEHFGISTE